MTLSHPWRPQGAAPKSLADTRRQLHWAAQVVAAVGNQLLPVHKDTGQVTLRWHEASGQLRGGIVDAARPFRAALAVEQGAMMFSSADGGAIGRFDLDGRTLAEAFGWMSEQASMATGHSVELKPSGLEINDHPVGVLDGGAVLPASKMNALTVDDSAGFIAAAERRPSNSSASSGASSDAAWIAFPSRIRGRERRVPS